MVGLAYESTISLHGKSGRGLGEPASPGCYRLIVQGKADLDRATRWKTQSLQ